MTEEDAPGSGSDVAEPTALQGAIAGVASGLVSRLVTFPADTLKARLQVAGALTPVHSNVSAGIRAESGSHLGASPNATNHTGATSTGTAARRLWAAEGPRGFFRGFGAVVLGAAPAQAVYFGGYEVGRKLVPSGHGVPGDMAVGCIAQLIAGTAFTPVDIIKERLQVQTLMHDGTAPQGRHAPPRHAAAALWAILRDAGPLGLFKGYWATNCVWLPWNVLYIALYEGCRRSSRSALGRSEDATLPAAATMACAFAAASTATVATHPPDVVKTRLQVLSAHQGPKLTFFGVLRDLLQKEGPRALWNGLGARVATIGPSAAITWALYEEVNAVLVENFIP
eukprot:jgi/Ulvmu1/1344/UM011_0072.1